MVTINPTVGIPDFSGPGPSGAQPQPFDPIPTSNPTPAPGVPSPTQSNPGTSGGDGGSSGGSQSSSGGPIVSIVKNFAVKSILLNPALTSHYVCKFSPPSSDAARSYFSDREKVFPGSEYSIRKNQDLIELSCSEASLPGSSLMTNEINDDYTGVTERHAYRRQYDDRTDFTFYVDRDYRILNFFESWISYCGKEDSQSDLSNPNYFYRFNFPEDYQTDDLYITKFERDVFGTALEYRFIGAYPISITSMPVSYDASQLLKCTVSFTYIRYIRRVLQTNKPTEPAPSTTPGAPPITTEQGDQINVPLPNTTTDGRPIPPFPGTGPVALASQRPAPGVPNSSTLSGQSGTSSGSSGVQPQPQPYNQFAGTGAVFNPTEEGNLELTIV